MKFLRRFRAPAEMRMPAANPEGARTYATLRDAVLRADPSKVGIRPTADLATVWGLVMDWSLETGVATIVSLADGTTRQS